MRNASASRVAAALIVVCASSLAYSQQVPWHELPSRGHASLGAFLHPPGLDTAEVGLEAVCYDGAFWPMLRLGRLPEPGGPDVIRVESIHSEDYLRLTSFWHHDPLTSRALPDDPSYASGFSMVMEWGGSLRVRVWFHPDDDPVLYTFGLDAFAAQVTDVPFLRASAAQSRSTWWGYGLHDSTLTSGIDQQVRAEMFCPAEGLPVLGLRFSEELDPGGEYIRVYVGSARPDAGFGFAKTGPGTYVSDSRAAELVLYHLVLHDETIGLQLFGGPRPFLVLEPANLQFLWYRLECAPGPGERDAPGDA